MNVDNGNTRGSTISHSLAEFVGVPLRFLLILCLQGGTFGLVSTLLFPAASSAQQLAPDTYQRVVDENIVLREEQARLVKEGAELRKKNANLIVDLQEIERKRDQLTALVAQLKTPEETKNDIARLQAEKVVLAREIDRLRQALSAVTPASTNPAPPVAAPEQGSSLFRKIEQENSDLRQQLARERESLQVALKANEALTSRDVEQRAETAKLSAELLSLGKDLEQSRTKEAVVWRAVDRIARKSYQQQVELEKLKDELAKHEAELARKTAVASGKGTVAAGANPRMPGATTVTDVNPGDTAGLLAAAQQALRSHTPKEAERLYGEALKRTPKDALIHYNLGALYSDYLKNPEKAIYHYRRYLDLNPRARDAAQVRSWLVELEIQATQ